MAFGPRAKNQKWPFWNHDLLSDDTMALRIMQVLLFRNIVGAKDTNPRNILVLPEGRVASIDDEADFDSPRRHLMWKTAVQPEKYRAALARVWDALLASTADWEERIMECHALTSYQRVLFNGACKTRRLGMNDFGAWSNDD